MDKETLVKKIEELESQRQQFVSQVNQTLGDFNGRIAILKELIGEMEPDEQDS